MRAAVWTALFLSALLATGCSYKRIAVRSAPAPPGVEHDEHADEREGTSTGALEWFLSRRAGEGATELPAEKYAAAREHVARMPRYSVAHGAVANDASAVAHAWTSLGPGNFGGRTHSFLINPRNPNIMYAGATTGGVFKSSDGRRLFLGGGNILWRSLDQGTNWTPAATVERGGKVSAIAVFPFDSNTVFLGTTQGYIYQSNNALNTDQATPWKSVQPRTGVVDSIALDPINPQVMYAVYSTLKSSPTQAHVYRSADGGKTWAPSDGSGATAVPDVGTWTVVVDPYTNSTVYLGTDLGLLVSTDSGATWARDPGLPSVYTERLTIDATKSWLFAFTNGRGANKTPLPGAPQLNCTFAVDQTEIDVDAYGGIIPVNVSAPDGCVWVAYPTYSNITLFGSIVNNTFASIQSPAQGSGNSAAFVSLPPNLLASAQTVPMTIAGNPVLVKQAAPVFEFRISDAVDKAPVITVPSMVRADTRTSTAAAGDPVHSCTGSADYKTVWWQLTPADDGYINVFVRGDRYDVSGSFGIVVTAYPQSDLTQELACASVPKSTTQVPTSIQFWASGGVTYLIEISTAGGNAAQDGGLASLVVTNGTGPVVTSGLTSSSRPSNGPHATQLPRPSAIESVSKRSTHPRVFQKSSM